MTREQAIMFIAFMEGRVGAAFHPDNEMDDYVMVTGQEFSEEERHRYDLLLKQAHEVLGNEVYDISLEAVHLFTPEYA